MFQYTVISFTIYTLTSRDAALSAQVAFVSLSLVNALTRPLYVLPNGIANIVQVCSGLIKQTIYHPLYQP